jgi:HSP20 family protein
MSVGRMGQRRIAAAQFVAALRNQAEVIVKSVNGSRLPVGNTMEFPGTALAEGIENPIVTDSDEKKEGITMAKEITVRKTEAPTAWRPFSDFDQWERDAQRMMEQFFGRPFMPWWPERWLRSEATDADALRVDVYFDKNDIVIKAECPGMEKGDIEVNLSDHLLTFRGEKKIDANIKEQDFLRRERVFGSFSRSLELPADVQDEKVTASFKNGILEIRLPAAEAPKAKTIQVKVEEGPTTSIGQN